MFSTRSIYLEVCICVYVSVKARSKAKWVKENDKNDLNEKPKNASKLYILRLLSTITANVDI